MKILYTIPSTDYGGTELYVLNMISHIINKEIEVSFLVLSSGTGALEETFKKFGNVFHLKSFKRRKDRIKNREEFFSQHEGKFDILHLNTSCSACYSIEPLAKKYGVKKIIVHSHNAGDESFVRRILNKLFRAKMNKYADKRLACSILAGEYLFGKKYKHDFIVAQNGIDIDKFIFNPDTRKQVKAQYKIEDSEFVVGHVGRMAKQKNHKFLLEIFSEILKLKSSSRLMLVGDGELRQEIELHAKELNIYDKIIFTGEANNVSQLLNAFDVFCMPSFFEGLPIVAVEAQANGLNYFAADSISEQTKINDNFTFISLNKSAKEWANAIVNSNNQRKNSEALELSKKGFNAKDNAETLKNIYKDLLR